MTARNGSGLIFRRYLLRFVVVAIVAAVCFYGDQVRRSSPELPDSASAGSVTSDTEIKSSQERSERKRSTTSVPREQTRKSETSTSEKQSAPEQTSESFVVRGLTLRDESGDVVYQGDIDLKPTIDRVAAGTRLRFRNDGSTFQNREARLPRKSAGYYREWVVPTPGDDGPGPQRLVTGMDGEVWYTPDHYRTFRRIPYQLP
jgi:ribonuclease T1